MRIGGREQGMVFFFMYYYYYYYYDDCLLEAFCVNGGQSCVPMCLMWMIYPIYFYLNYRQDLTILRRISTRQIHRLYEPSEEVLIKSMPIVVVFRRC